jgi:uncharacterized protein (DUF1810 family)
MSDLEKFVTAQDGAYGTALAEIRAGSKRSHWMWFVFPQIAGLGLSSTAQRYALSGLDEARDFLAHPVLGRRLREISQALLDLTTGDARQVLGTPDDLKLRSSMTLFAAAADDPAVFEAVLAKFYDGPDERTLTLLSAQAS